jgi:hypothetical protein
MRREQLDQATGGMALPVPSTVLLAAIVLAAPVAADGWTPPEGCAVYLTVQSRSCVVSHHYRCQSDPDGYQWRADFRQDDPAYLSLIDDEGQWLEGRSSQTDRIRRLVPNSSDPASMSKLLSSGLDTFDYMLSYNDGDQFRRKGSDRLTGRTVVIDGIELLETELEATERELSGELRARKRGNEYVHPEWRVFFGGSLERAEGDGPWQPSDGSPVEFIFPGEDGFLSTQPKYDCDVVTAALSVWRVRHEP